MLTGPMLLVVFLFSIALLLVTIIKFRMNAFLSLLLTSLVTAVLVRVPTGEIGSVLATGFGNTLAGIGIVTGLGVMLGQFLFESGGIETIADTVLRKLGDKRSPQAIAFSGFLSGIPIFGDVVYIMFAPMLRVLAKKTGISLVTFACALSVATTCTFALVIPTPAPLAVAESLKLDTGVFFLYAIITAFIGCLAGGIFYGKLINWQDQRRGHHYTFEDVEAEEEELAKTPERPRPSFGRSISILLVPILLILFGSFVPMVIGEGQLSDIFRFIGDKNVAMLIGVLYAYFASRPFLRKSAADVITSAADQVGLILLITGAGGAFGYVLQYTGIADYVAGTLSGYNIPILILCFLISQIIRCAQGSTTVALMTTASILSGSIALSGVSPVLCAIAICAGGIGLSLPNDSGFWAISRFFGISVQDTIRGWTVGGFVAGVACLVTVCLMALMQNVLPGL